MLPAEQSWFSGEPRNSVWDVPMINKWTLYNFKSVERAELLLSPLTLFAGANSSGKSTFLQSILLVSQTLGSRVGSQTVVLNGHLAKLGQFSDLRTATSDSDTIRIAWELSVPPQRVEEPRYLRSPITIETISCDIAFGVPKIGGLRAHQLNPKLFESVFSCTGTSSSGEVLPSSHSVRLISKPQPEQADPDGPQQEAARVSPWTFEYEIQFDPTSLEELRDDLSGATPIGCSLQHFLPQWLVETFDEKTEVIRLLTRPLLDPIRSRVLSRNVDTDAIAIPREIIAFLNQRRSTFGKSDEISADAESGTASLTEVMRWLRGARLRQKPKASGILKELSDLAVKAVQEKQGITTVEVPSLFRDALNYLTFFFSRSVRYLGPLREEPRSLYPLQTTADPQDIGLHGEHTAAVFHSFRYSEIEYIPSAAFSSAKIDRTPTKASLADAVFDWLQYLDVAKKVETHDEGKFGHGLLVQMDSNDKHDLTHVGVGVSQVLPIVVMCLLATHDTTLILEQPELHLNPKVQTRLGDFFLAMSLLGKQCLIETHSEYLINRLRYRAAAAPSDSISKMMALYFVEKQRGVTVHRNVMVNEFGAIIDWPVGFFDQSQREVEDILLAATKKAKGEVAE
jgi:predicted ATPase